LYSTQIFDENALRSDDRLAEPPAAESPQPIAKNSSPAWSSLSARFV